MIELCIILVCLLLLCVIILYCTLSQGYNIEVETENELKGELQMLTMKIKYIRDIKPIEIFEIGDCIDLRCAEDIELEAGEFVVIPLGVAMELPVGYMALVVPRSSTFKKWGVIQTNSVGIIDESYCGDEDEWGFPCIALRHTKIHKNDRICQFMLLKKDEPIEFLKVKTLGNENRNGFGSTGEK